MVLAVQGLGGTRLAADAVARHLGVLTGAAHVVDNALHVGADHVRGLLADDLADLLRLVVADHVAVVVRHGLDDVRFHEVPAVDDGGQGADELDGGGGKTLAEGGGGKLGLAELIRRPEHALLLAGQLDAGGAGKAEVFPVFPELIFPQGLADLNEGRVAGVHHGPAQGLGAVAASGGAADVPVADVDLTGTDEGAVVGDGPLLQARRHHDGLEGRAWLIGGVQGLVVPLLELGGVEGRFILLFRGRVLDLVQGALQDRVLNGAGVVQVVVRGAGHAQHGPGVRVHDQAEAAVDDVELGNALLQGLLRIHLDGGVDGGVDVVAVDRVDVAGIGRGHLLAGGVLIRDDLAVGARQVQVIQGLQAVSAGVGAVDKANDLGGHGGVGVVALGVVGQIDGPLQLVLLDEGPHLVGDILLHLFGQDLIGRLGLLQPGHDLRAVDAQDAGEVVGDEVIGALQLALLLRLDGSLGAGVAELILGLYLTLDVVH